MPMGSTMGHVLGMPNGAAWLPAPGAVNAFSMPLTAHDASGQPLQVSHEHTVSARVSSSHSRCRPWPDPGSATRPMHAGNLASPSDEPFPRVSLCCAVVGSSQLIRACASLALARLL